MSATPSGSYAGEVRLTCWDAGYCPTSDPKRIEFRDHNGRFLGSSVKTGKDTWTHYDKDGHFLGTSRESR